MAGHKADRSKKSLHIGNRCKSIILKENESIRKKNGYNIKKQENPKKF